VRQRTCTRAVTMMKNPRPRSDEPTLTNQPLRRAFDGDGRKRKVAERALPRERVTAGLLEPIDVFRPEFSDLGPSVPHAQGTTIRYCYAM